MYCYKCGKEINGNDTFCSSCGANVKGGNGANAGNNTGRTPIQIVIPSLKGLDVDAVKKLAVKIAFLVIAIFTFSLSRDGLFVIHINDYYWGYDYYKEVGVSELVDYIEEDIEMISDTSSEVEDTNLTMLRFAKWCVIIGIISYLTAAIVVFFEAEALSHFLTSLSGILHIIFVIFSVIVLQKVFQLESIFDVIDFFSDSMWWYLVLNIVLFVISKLFFWEDETAKTYAGKTYSLLEKSDNTQNRAPSKSAVGSWRCIECGRINPNYCQMCACGNEKK